MKNVLEACVPRKSIKQGTFNPEIFTASLDPVIQYYHHTGNDYIDSLYTDAEMFFREATYPTDGLRQTVGSVFRRISGDSSVPAIYRLETSFGGGKTHTLIACVHIAYKGKELKNVTRDIVNEKYLPEPGSVIVVGIAGDNLSVQKVKGEQLIPYTIWGEMAYQIGGETLYTEVQGEAESMASPGKPFFDKVLGNKKIIIMLDELAQYAARLEAALPSKGADQLSAFLMSLNNYAKTHTGISVIVTLASAADAFSKQTKALTEKLNEIREKELSGDEAVAFAERANKSVMSVVSREATVVTPVQASEISRVLGKRLFESIDSEAAHGVMQAYTELYQRNMTLLPEEANNVNFQQRILENYPFHPKLVDFLNQKLALAENFQGTRGVLRVLALTVRAIWENKLPVYLIHASDIDLRKPAIVDEILGKTGSSDLRNVLNTDIGSIETKNLVGGKSQAQLADERNPHPDGIPMYELTWKTVFLNSLVGRAEGKRSKVFGINQRDAVFMTSSPRLTPTQVKTALDAITQDAFYLRCEDGKYFAHQDPTINSVLARIRQNVSSGEVHNKLKSIVSTMIQDDSIFHIEHDVHLPQDIPDNQERLTVAVVSLDVEEIDPMVFYETKGPNLPRTYQNMMVMLIPKTSHVLTNGNEMDLFENGNSIRANKNNVEVIARQVIAMQKLQANPQSFGINPSQLNDPEFIERKRDRELGLVSEVSNLYNSVYFAKGNNIEHSELRGTSTERGAAFLTQIVNILRTEGQILSDTEEFKTSELQSLAQQFFFRTKDHIKVRDVLQFLRTNRSWPMLPQKNILEKIVREGVKKGCWVIYKMSQHAEETQPEEIYTQEKTVSLDISLFNDGYSLMPVEKAKIRGWLDKDKVPSEKVKTALEEILQSNGDATVGALISAVQTKYNNVGENQVKGCLREMVNTSAYSVYNGQAGQTERPEFIDSYDISFNDFESTDVIITKDAVSERGWSTTFTANTLLSGISAKDTAKKIYPLLNKLSSWYTRGKAKTNIKYLSFGGLQLPSGATLRVDFGNLTPRDIKELDEFFAILTHVAKLSDSTDAEIELDDTTDDSDELIKQLKM